MNLIDLEKRRQTEGIELIASENYASDEVMAASGSILTNKYAEGLPGKRYYGGNLVIDEIENLCKERSLKAFDLNPKDFNVLPIILIIFSCVSGLKKINEPTIIM